MSIAVGATGAAAATGAPGCLHLHDGLSGQHGVLHEVEVAAIGAVAEVREQHVGASHDAGVEVGVHEGASPDAEPLVLRDLGHVGIEVLAAHLRRNLARPELDVAILDTPSVAVGHEAAHGEGVCHLLAHIVAGSGHRGSRGEGASRGSGSGATSALVADGFSKLLSVLGPHLLGHQVHAQVRIAARGGRARDDVHARLLGIFVEVEDSQGPRHLSTDVEIVHAQVDTTVDHDVALGEHVRTCHVDDRLGTLAKIYYRVDVVVRHLHDGGVLPLGTAEFSVSHLFDL
mmetsp:Transcript_163806/g.525349  ORF Transcript_163806/g.525349 Transcript_163806/m.525349 type:complete len:287 (-) Transcript_163806:402-1262(-)